ncbi:sugar ABC transporter ATP-binding protein [Aidingimonas lacisalsi]|uniref:sugar ABC transporter ATP-binding protein n=1 Tax=Aidingimonas lacisalsi TaxID=2604086 RepID=UPI0011D28E22|nr:sugar ABC transporter ATP-binding protein [Aidingimonas lacisalsi]
MAYLSVDRVSKEFPGVRALDDVSLDIELGQVHTLAGENGAGKSTLVKMLTGLDRPTDGRVIIGAEGPGEQDSHEAIAYVPQEINLFVNMTVAENLFMPFSRTHPGMGLFKRRNLEREAQSWIERFNIHARPSDKVTDISVSDQQLLQIARACTNEHMKVLILDEPTSALTDAEVDRVFAVVRDVVASGCAVVFISHKFDEMFAISDVISVLRNGRLRATCQADELTQDQLIELMSGEEIDTDTRLQPESSPGDLLLRVSGLSGKGFEDVSFDLRRGEVLGFAGLVGAGRSEVMQTLLGFLPKRAGEAEHRGRPWKFGDTRYAVRQGLAYLSEDRKFHGIFPGQSLRRNIGMSLFHTTGKKGVIAAGRERGIVHDIIASYDIKTSTIDKDIVFLSGGNQQKAIIGRAMACSPDILIFDEPTKGIDIRTKMDIYRLVKELAENGVGVILVSSEMDELNRCASRIITMYEGRISGEFNTESATNNELIAAIHGHTTEEPAA